AFPENPGDNDGTTVRALAKRLGVTASVLHYYRKFGLLIPHEKRLGIRFSYRVVREAWEIAGRFNDADDDKARIEIVLAWVTRENMTADKMLAAMEEEAPSKKRVKNPGSGA